MNKIRLLLSLTVFLFLSGSVLADSVGTLTLEKGILKIRRNHMDQTYRAPASGISVENRDELQTGMNTRVKIDMSAKSDKIDLFSSTFFVISVVEPEKSEFKMPLGKARFKVAKSRRAGKKRRFRLRTANALVGVKGTEFVVGVSNGDTSLLALSGLVSMANLAAPEVQVEVQANQATKIQQNKAPTPPVVVPPQVQESIVEGDSAAEFEAVDFGEAPDLPTDNQSEKSSGDQEEAGTEETEDAADAEEAVDTESLIEEVTETVEDVQEDVGEIQTNEKSIEFKIIKN